VGVYDCIQMTQRKLSGVYVRFRRFSAGVEVLNLALCGAGAAFRGGDSGKLIVTNIYSYYFVPLYSLIRWRLANQ
jgi:hypothetical protein